MSNTPLQEGYRPAKTTTTRIEKHGYQPANPGKPRPKDGYQPERSQTTNPKPPPKEE